MSLTRPGPLDSSSAEPRRRLRNTRGEPQRAGTAAQGPGWQVMAGPGFRFPEVHDGLTKGTTRYRTLHHMLPTCIAQQHRSRVQSFAGSSRQKARSLRHSDPRVLKFPGLPFAAPFPRIPAGGHRNKPTCICPSKRIDSILLILGPASPFPACLPVGFDVPTCRHSTVY